MKVDYSKFIELATPILLKNESFIDQIHDYFENDAEDIIQNIRSNQLSISDEEWDTIYEIVENLRSDEVNIVHSIDAEFQQGPFSIDIRELGGMYYIQAVEFDEEGYFDSLNEAIEFASKRFDVYIDYFKSARNKE